MPVRDVDFRCLEYRFGQATVWSSVHRCVLPSVYGQRFPASDLDVGRRALLGVCGVEAVGDCMPDSALLEVEVENPRRRACINDGRFRRTCQVGEPDIWFWAVFSCWVTSIRPYRRSAWAPYVGRTSDHNRFDFDLGVFSLQNAEFRDVLL